MEEKVSSILDLFPNLTITTVEKILKDNNNNVESSIEYLLNNNIDEINLNNNSSNSGNNLNNCGKGFSGNDGSNDNEFKSKEDEENERLFKEFMKNEEIENEKLNKSKSHSCEICLMDLPIEDFYILDECEHRFCTDCLSAHFSIQIRSGYSNLKCPEIKCRYIASYDEARQLLNKEVFERYDRLLLNSHLQKDKNIFTCPEANCGMKMVVNKGHDQFVECVNQECGGSFCIECREEAHQGITCTEMADIKRELASYLMLKEESETLSRAEIQYQYQQLYGRANRNLRGKINKRLFFIGKKVRDYKTFSNFMTEIKNKNSHTYGWIIKNTMMCPHCFSLVEKSHGCNDLACFCGNSFCFGCGVKESAHGFDYPCSYSSK